MQVVASTPALNKANLLHGIAHFYMLLIHLLIYLPFPNNIYSLLRSIYFVGIFKNDAREENCQLKLVVKF